MTSNEIRTKYLAFFEKRGHTIIPSSSLVPQDDPTTLFTGSGMQPLLPYLLGQPHPKGKRLVDSQKSFRAEDIEEVGDNRHTTFFEMLGNWSLGDYFKEEQINWFWEFLTKEMGLDPNRIYVSCYIGNKEAGVPKDTESAEVWNKIFTAVGIDPKQVDIGTEEKGYEMGEQGGRIFFYGEKNWWSRAGAPSKMPVGEPGGPDTEMFYLFPQIEHDPKWGEHCHPNCDCGRYIELGNSVFMEYIRTENAFEKLPQKNVDYGGGLERITAAASDKADVFETDLFAPLIHLIEEKGISYTNEINKVPIRIVADHLRGAVFMIADGVLPSNTEHGYILRRLLRRAIYQLQKLGITSDTDKLVEAVINPYEGVYPEVTEKVAYITRIIEEESEKFKRTLERGLKKFEKLSKNSISGKDAFVLFSTYGFPLELTLELAQELNVSVDEEGFKKEMEKHQKESRAGAEQKFKGGLADAGKETVKLHTATHLVLAGLRKYLGDHVHQAGSNITTERTRFDFTHPQKVERDVLDKVESYVNEAIAKGARVEIEQMPKEEAQKSGVEGSFWEKYPDTVNVYKVIAPDGTVYSRELCGGPHVESTSEIGEGNKKFVIKKEEAVSAGVRRIKAVLE